MQMKFKITFTTVKALTKSNEVFFFLYICNISSTERDLTGKLLEPKRDFSKFLI